MELSEWDVAKRIKWISLIKQFQLPRHTMDLQWTAPENNKVKPRRLTTLVFISLERSNFLKYGAETCIKMGVSKFIPRKTPHGLQ